VFHPLVLTAYAFPVFYRTEYLGTEEAVAFRLECAVIIVSGFFTSPKDHSLILSGEASFMRIASKSVGFLGF